MNKINIIVSSSFGLESVVANELRDLGYENLQVNNGYVEFVADFDAIAKTNLWLRCADRVYWKITEFRAVNFDELFENVKSLNWKDILPKDAQFPISSIHVKDSKLFSKSDCQSIIKKAIVENLKQVYHVERFAETGAFFSIRVQIINDIVSVWIDTSGEALHKRGYRAVHGEAPIKETLAAGLVLLSRWGFDDRALLDPVCGTATILIEAAMIAKNIAPGKNRTFASEHWPIISQEIWDLNRKEAHDLEKRDIKPLIFGSDINNRMIDIAKKNIRDAGFEDCISVKTLPLKDISSAYKHGVIIANPPYGERLSEAEDTEELYKDMGRVFENMFPDWSYFIITSNTKFENLFGKRSTKNRKLYNGGIKCYLYQYFA